MRASLRLLVLLLVAAAALPALAAAADGEAEREAQASPLERAVEEAGGPADTRGAVRVPGGSVTVAPQELLAAARTPVTIAFTAGAAAADGDTLTVTLPPRWTADVPSGIDAVQDVHLARDAGGRANLSRDGRRLTLTLHDPRPGDRAEIELRDNGIPASAYALPLAWNGADAGSARIAIFAPVREGAPTERTVFSRLPSNTSELLAPPDASGQAEATITAVPGIPSRVVAAANEPVDASRVFVSADGGGSFTAAPYPTTMVVKSGPPTHLEAAGDPMVVADHAGNVWYGELTTGATSEGGVGIVSKSRMSVARIPAGQSGFTGTAVGLERGPGATGQQDKGQIALDDWPASPHYGRLYVTWGSGINTGQELVMSFCDTRPGGGALDAAHCDAAANWSTPVSYSGGFASSVIYADVAPAPDGTLYATWWDYSNTNAIMGTTCPAGADCSTAGAWTDPQTIALLTTTAGAPIPFVCETVAQPGGRVAPAPQVTAGPDGRVWVTWGDLQVNPGSRTCEGKPGGPQPTTTLRRWHAYVASRVGALPGGDSASASSGSDLLTGAENANESDTWFANLAVDRDTGQAWTGFYSTRLNADRAKADAFVRALTPSGSATVLGPLLRMSTVSSGFAGNLPCCNLDNEFGDYEGIDAANGQAYAAWTDNRPGLPTQSLFVGCVADTPCTKPPPPPPPPADSDGDGFTDDVDKCPTQAGVAPDGCPNITVLPTVPKLALAKSTLKGSTLTMVFKVVTTSATIKATLTRKQGRKTVKLGRWAFTFPSGVAPNLKVKLKKSELRRITKRKPLKATLAMTVTVPRALKPGVQTFAVTVRKR